MNKKLIIWIIVILILLVAGYFVYAALKSGDSAGTGLASLKGSCADSDGGKNYAVQGTVSKGTTSNTDVCTSTTVLKEYFCSGSSIKSASYTCASEYKCENGACILACTPATCTSLGKNCGTWANGCGSNLNCGTCPTGQNCSNGICTPTCTPTTCASLGKNCGTWANGCGSNLNCGTCLSGYSCNATGQCAVNQTCTNECVSGSKRCSVGYAQTCGNYDADSCTEWNTGTYCVYSCSGGVCLSVNQTNQTG